MTTATAPMPGQGGPQVVQEKYNKLAETLSEALGGLHFSSPHAAMFKNQPPSSQEGPQDEAQKKKEQQEQRNLLERLFTWIQRLIRGLIDGFKRFFGMSDGQDAKGRDLLHKAAVAPGATAPGMAAAQGDPLKAANDPRAEKAPANDGQFQHNALAAMKGSESASTVEGDKVSAHQRNAASAPGALENGWVVEGEGKSRSSAAEFKQKYADISDADLKEISSEPLKLVAPTYLLPGNSSEADMLAHAMEAINDTVTRQLQNPDVVSKLKEAAQMQDETEAEKVFTKLLLGPAFGDAEMQSEALRNSLAEQIIQELTQEDSVDESLAQVTAQAVVEGLPANIASQMLPPDQADRVTQMLERRAQDIERLASFHAMLGSRPAIFDGTFDYLKERQAGDVTVFDQSHYKLQGKKDQEQALEEFKKNELNRPRG
jgi:hypothetical protein